MIERLLELKEKLEENIWQHGVTTYKITEENSKISSQIYKVNFMQIDIEKEVVMLINENDDILLNFLISSVHRIKIMKDVTNIILKNGKHIKIEIVA